jgi:three-Cys-motif partner protein
MCEEFLVNTESSVPQEYWGREQSLIKHTILQKYLQPAARIIGSAWPTFTYVDCCSGPWNVATEDYSDTSFGIAIQQLRGAREYLLQRGTRISIRCLFVEANAASFAKLKQFCKSVTDIEVEPLQGDFTAMTQAILDFINERRNPFTFFFIDPTGWAPLALDQLAPLLHRSSSEVLINFMTSHIRRSLQSAGIAANVGPDYMRKVFGATRLDRDDAPALSFADELRERGFYRYTCTSVVLHPTDKRTHYHLIYGTRNIKGVEKFKEAERSCFPLMQSARLDAQRRDSGAMIQDVLNVDWLPDTDPCLLALKQRYLQLASTSIQREAHRGLEPLTSETAWEVASRFPLVWRADLRNLCPELSGLDTSHRSPSPPISRC